jgi:hypothetical protein
MPWTLAEVEEIDKLLQDPSIGPEVKSMFQQKKLQQEQEDAKTGVTEDSLDPNLDMVAQVHATMPKATGEAAVDPQGALERSQGKGVVFFYEPPREFVQQKMMDPDYLKAIDVKAAPTPEEIQSAAPGMPLYDKIADEEFRKAGSAADAAGKVGYRVSREPWFGSDKMGVLDRLKSFGTQLQAQVVPALEGASAFVLGVDDTAGFEIGQNVASVTGENGDPGRPSGAGGDEYVKPGRFNTMTREGLDKTQRQAQDQLREDNPMTVLAGQIAGVVSPWSLTNRLANYVTSGIRTALPSATGIPLAAAAGATAGVTMGGAQLAADTAGKSAEQGQYVPPTPEAVGNAAMEAPYGAGLGAVGEGVGQLASELANSLRQARFTGVQKGAIGDLEQVGDLNISTWGGIKPTPRAADIVDEATRVRANPVNVSAERLTPKMLETVNTEREALKAETQEFKQKFYETPEGRSKKSTQGYTDKLLKQLGRHSTLSSERGVYEPNDAAGKELIGRFNADVVDGVSLSPKDGVSKSPVDLSGKSLEDFGYSPGDIDRPSTLEALRADKRFRETGRVTGTGRGDEGEQLGIKLRLEDDGSVNLYDGTNRFKVAKEMDLPSIYGTVYDSSGQKVLYQGDIPMKASGSRQIELTPEQAEGWLAPVWQKRALPDKLPKSDAEKALDKKLGTGDSEKGFAARLRAQGVEKVYVTPKHRTAQEAEDLMDDLDVWKNGKTVPGEVLNDLDAGLRADRKARSPDFDEGLKQRSDKKTQLDTMVSRTAGHGNPQRGEPELQLTRSLSSFGSGARGSKPTDDALRQLGDKAGVRPELEAHASLDPMLRLVEASRFRTGGTGVLDEVGPSGLLNAAKPRMQIIDPLAIRSFPAARALGAEGTSPIRQGRAARATALDIPASLRGMDSSDALIRQQLQMENEEQKR